MQRLRADQTVALTLDEVPEPISCRVTQVQGTVARLAYRSELPPRAVGQLVLGTAGYLLFEDFGVSVGLRVAVRPSPPYLDVAVIDGVAPPERRRGDRIKLVARAGVVPPEGERDGEHPVEWTHTIDLSEGGALLRDHEVFERHQRFTLELMFGDDPQPITAQAAVVRHAPDAVGVAFESIATDDANRLSEYLTGVRQQRRVASLV